MHSNLRFRHLLAAALLGGLVAQSLPVLAAQVGDALGLGESNTVNAPTTLRGDASRNLVVKNIGDGIPLSLVTSKNGEPPMVVDSKKRVRRLNADLLDGRHASAFLAKDATAANADLLDGKNSTAFALVDHTHTELEGRVAAIEDAIGGDMWAKVDADAGSATLLFGDGVVAVNSIATGIFSVTFDQSVVGCGWIATRNDNLDGVSTPGEISIELGSSLDPFVLWVRTFDSTGTAADPSSTDGFTLLVDC